MSSWYCLCYDSARFFFFLSVFLFYQDIFTTHSFFSPYPLHSLVHCFITKVSLFILAPTSISAGLYLFFFLVSVWSPVSLIVLSLIRPLSLIFTYFSFPACFCFITTICIIISLSVCLCVFLSLSFFVSLQTQGLLIFPHLFHSNNDLTKSPVSEIRKKAAP